MGRIAARAADPTDRLAGLAGLAADAPPIGAARRQAGGGVEGDDGGGEAVGQKGRDAADGAGPALGIVKREVALGGGVELQDAGNGEAVLEGGPDIAAQAVAADHPQAMVALVRARRRRREIAAELADILEERAVPANDVVPEPAGGELRRDHHRGAGHQHGAGRHHAADAVVHRQAVIEPVVRARVEHAGEPAAPAHHPMVADTRGLGQAGGAGGVDQERRVADGDDVAGASSVTGGAFGPGPRHGPDPAALGPDAAADLGQDEPPPRGDLGELGGGDQPFGRGDAQAVR